jgi:hypothetical protein
MKPPSYPNFTLSMLAAAVISCLASCSTTQESSTSSATSGTSGNFPSKYKSDDGRSIEIGKGSQANGGWSFKDPHLEKCWIAEDFKFTGYDTLYIAPTASTAKFQEDERRPHDLAKESLPREVAKYISPKGLFTGVLLQESEIKAGGRTLKLENTIIEYSKGGGGARYWVGLYGGGQPVLRVQGKMTDGDKTVFTFEARRSGTSAGARMGGAFMKDEDIQIEDVRSMALDLTDFMAAIAGKYQPR